MAAISRVMRHGDWPQQLLGMFVACGRLFVGERSVGVPLDTSSAADRITVEYYRPGSLNPGDVHKCTALGHEWDGHDIILAVNIDRARVNAKFDLNFRYGSSSGGIMRSRFTREPLVRVLFEDRDVMVINDTIKDYFAPMDTHIYLLPPY